MAGIAADAHVRVERQRAEEEHAHVLAVRVPPPVLKTSMRSLQCGQVR